MPRDRSFPPALGDERAVLGGWLDFQRATVHRKCAGLTDEAAWSRPVAASPLSVAAVVAHLRWTEWHWLERSFLGASPEDHGGGWDVEPGRLADLLDEYAGQCERSRAIVADHALDEVEAHAPGGTDPVNLRWILGHLVEETARHLGHVDLLRESLDGQRGY